MKWTYTQKEKKLPRLRNTVLIEGLPGIGNVGKIAVDFLIEELKCKKLFEITSHSFPHSVFVNEDNLIEIPMIEIYYTKLKKNDILFLTGDVQPIDEISSYEFCEKILEMFKQLNGKEIITLGGIGLQDVPKTPIVYCTGNSKEMVTKYKKGTKINTEPYGVVGPIIGVTGLLLGLSKRKKVPAIALLAETIGHPMYLGITGAREILKILNKKLDLNFNIKKLDKEIASIEGEMLKTTKELSDVQKNLALKKVRNKFGSEQEYIG